MTIRSKVMQEERPLQVHLPRGYETNTDRYPVLILLDGRTDFHHVIGITEFLAANYKALPMIVVGVSNTNRTRDLTPAVRQQTAIAHADMGGADRFLEFIESELLPTIDGKYRSSPYRVLVGRSHGGLFTLHAFITRPNLFDAYIAIDPSFWWDEAALFSQLISHLSEQGGLNRTVFVADATRDKQLLESLDAAANAEMWLGFRKKAQLASWLSTKAPDDLKWAVREYPDDDHGSVTHRAVYDGLELIFSDMNKSAAELFELVRDGGLEAVDAYYAALAGRYGVPSVAPEAVVNTLGYGFLQTDRERAILLFEENVKRFPNSPNTHDSLGDAYAANQQLDQALESYRMAVKLANKQRHPNRALYRQKLDRIQAYLDQP
ncbi:alpha/beta hydrolase-fold protein [Candidatus Neomarinimicrobiota bacterium]